MKSGNSPYSKPRGLGIMDGSVDDMLEAVKAARDRGKVSAMKPLGGGSLIRNFRECLEFVLGIPHMDSIAIGMQCDQELEPNLAMFEVGRWTPRRKRPCRQRGGY